MDSAPSFGARVALAFAAFFRVLFDAPLAGRVQRALLPGATDTPAVPSPAPTAAPAPAPTPPANAHVPASLAVLAMLQREGRLVDFLMEDMDAFKDEEVGAAVRVVHKGCRKLLQQYVKLEPVMTQAEGDRVSVPAGFDAARIRLVGNVVGNPPFSGTLKHKGWRAVETTFPAPATGLDPTVVAPAEVEL